MKPLATLLISFLILCILSGCNQTTDEQNCTAPLTFETTTPEDVGMSSNRLARIDDYMNECIEKGWFPGGVVFIARHGKIAYHKGFGVKEAGTDLPMSKEAIFRIASQTKAITSLAAMMLYEEGKFRLNDPVEKYIPEFKDPEVLIDYDDKTGNYTAEIAEVKPTIRHLLTHTSGLIYDAPMYEKHKIPAGFVSGGILADKMTKLADLPLIHEPGEKFSYGLNTDMLGYLVEVLSGMSLSEYMTQEIFEPLGMEDTYFHLPEDKHEKLIPVFSEDKSSEQLTEINEQFNYPVAGDQTYYSGGAGLSSTITDYAKFMQMFLNNGTYNNTRLLGPKTVELITKNHVGDLFGDGGFGLGFLINSEESSLNEPGSVGSYGWGGYYGTNYWIDPEEELIGLIFLQLFESQHGDEVHSKFRVLTYQAIVD